MNEQIVALVKAAMAGDLQATLQINQIMQAAQQGDQQAAQIAQMILTVAQLLSLKAKFGAKLNYLKTLKGNCPEGYELHTFKIGGKVCLKCYKAQEGTLMEEPKNVAEAFKCGRKMKKKAEGGLVDKDKCGSKMKKKAEGGSVEEAKCGSKMKKKEDGGKVDAAKCGKKMKKENGGTFPFSITALKNK